MNNKQEETSSGEAKVFVLPPNILEKLGINLCNLTHNVRHSQESKRRKNKPKNNEWYSNQEEIAHNVRKNTEESSILETANLMKNSVFLSPTFVSMVGDNISGEVEISKHVEPPKEFTQTADLAMNDNNCNKQFNQENITFELEQDENLDSFCNYKQQNQSGILKRTDSNAQNTLRGQSINSGSRKINGQIFSDSITNSNLNLDNIETKTKFEIVRVSDLDITLTLNNNVQSINLHKEVHTSQIKNSYNTGSNTNHEKEITNEKSISTSNKFENRIEPNGNSMIPVSVLSKLTSSLNEVADNSHDFIMNKTFIDGDTQKHRQQVPPPVSTISESTEVDNNVNSNISRNFEYDESGDMKLNNILHEAEILIPISSSTDSEYVDVVAKKKNQESNEVIENDILVTISSELMNISDINQNIGDTQQINVDIIFESFDDNIISDDLERNDEFNQKSIVCELVNGNQSNGDDTNATHSNECYETSDMELENMLRETEILTSAPMLPSETIISSFSNIVQKQSYKERKLSIEKERKLSIEKESDIVWNKNELSPISKLNNTVNEEINLNGALVNTSNIMPGYNPLVENNLSQVLKDNDKNTIFEQNVSINNKDDYLMFPDNIIVLDSVLQLDHTSSAKHVEENIGCENSVNTTLEYINKYIDDNLLETSNVNFDVNNPHKEVINDYSKSEKLCETKENENKIEAVYSNAEKLTNTIENETDKTTINCKQIDTNCTLSTDTSCNSLPNETVETVIDDKVHEIVKYLKQAYQNTNKNKHRKKDARISKLKLESHVRSKIIHGVEKPGGSKDELVFNKLNTHKIYKRIKKEDNSHVNHVDVVSQNLFETVSKPQKSSTEIMSDIEPSKFLKRQEYCICGDFGKITFADDNDIFYEHIHFGCNISVNCPVDTVFEIYEEKIIDTLIENKEYTLQEKENINEDDSGHICWQKIEFLKDNNIDTKVQFKENTECVEKTNLKTDKPVRGNNTTLIKEKSESICILKQQVTKLQNEKASDENTVTNEICTEMFTEFIIEENKTVSQMDTELKEKEDTELKEKDDTKLKEKENTEPKEKEDFEIKEKEEVEIKENKDTELKEETELKEKEDTELTENEDTKSKGKQDTDLKKNKDTKLKEKEDSELKEAELEEKINAELKEKVDTELKENEDTEVIEKEDTNVQISEMDKIAYLEQNEMECAKQNINSSEQEINRNVAITDCTTNIPEIVHKSDVHIKSRKRKIMKDEEPSAKKNLKCGVCEQMFAEFEWENHISNEHCYIAWKEGHSFDLENLLLLKQLKKKLKCKGSVICTFCGFEYVKLTKFLAHVKKCLSKKMFKMKTDSSQSQEVATTSHFGKIKCGVCQVEVLNVKWIQHISHEHQYLAWKDGEAPLDIQDENKVKKYLLDLNKKYGPLICTKCGLDRKYTAKSIKNYITHIGSCRTNNASRNSRRRFNSDESANESTSPPPTVYKCAVCMENVDDSKWIDHISKKHNYRAWKVGDEAPNLEDEYELKEYLNIISKQEGGLQCPNCGVVRKYVKSYLQHTESCKVIQVKTTTQQKTNADADGLVIANNIDSHVEMSQPDVSNSDVVEADSPNKSKEKIQTENISIETSHMDLSRSESTESPYVSTSKGKLPSKQNTVSCAVCNIVVDESAWLDHIGKEHNYIAWMVGEAPLNTDDKQAVWQHLYNIVSKAGKLTCGKCGIERKYPKSFLHHISDCRGPDPPSEDTMSLNYSVVSNVDSFLLENNLQTSAKDLKCGVCQEEVPRKLWIAHIQIAHNYMAWVDGDAPLDLNNQDILHEHLRKIVDEIGTLICSTCGTSRKYAKNYLEHVQNCSEKKKTKNDEGNSSQGADKLNADEAVNCGLCKQKVRVNQWINHIRMTHNYIAWRNSQAPVNMQKTASVEKRLRVIIDKIHEVICPKCGYKSKEVETYLNHTRSCTGNPDYEIEDDEVTSLAQKGLYQCGLCKQKVKYGEWKNHAVDKHYNVAWVVGDEPIDLRNQHEITKKLKDYLLYGSYVCKVCGMARNSAIGFYAHFITCGLSEEESDKYKSLCEICNAKYLGIYKSQHMAAHTQQEMVKERMKKAQELKDLDRQRKLDDLVSVSRKRRAAEKARMVIEETVSEIKHVCQSCGFATDTSEEMSTHKCPKRRKISEDLDVTIEQEESSDDDDIVEEISEKEDDDDDVVEIDGDDDDNNEYRTGRKRHSDQNASSRITRIPFTIQNLEGYISKYVTDTTEHYMTTETLFPQWTKCNYEAVPEGQLLEFLPPLEESCKVYSNNQWSTYKRWQGLVDVEKASFFVGYSICKLSWLPAHAQPVSQHDDRNYLAVACHAGVDCPQYNIDDLPEHHTLIQIWDFGNFKKIVPKLVFGLVIPFGSVWAMDWCPSGARECLKEENSGFMRMGLLAVACSNGMAYILSVPYPSTVVSSDTIFYKLKPVAQLRFTMKSDRQKYQATSICWSKQKGHATVIVGYADGTTAYYDLNTESPLLKSQESNVTIIYPFFDERIHNSCITDMSTFPMAYGSSAAGAAGAAGAVAVTSPTGSAVVSAAASGACARLRSHLAASRAGFLPAWPAVCLAGEDVITNLSPNELEYWGWGRRIGPSQTCCCCEQCGLVASYMAPFLRRLRPHHGRSELYKQTVAWIGTKQLGKKRKQTEDKKELVPKGVFTYDDAVVKYGIEFKLTNISAATDQHTKSITFYKDVNPEIFPLSDVPSMAFCPTPKHHNKLAVATHAGLIFVITV